MKGLILYPTYDVTADDKFFSISETRWFYEHNGLQHDLDVSDQGIVSAHNNLRDWNAGDYGISLREMIVISGANNLFYPKNNAITCHDSEIGIALLWSSPNSFQRGVIEIGVVKNTEEFQTLNVCADFSPGTFRDSLDIEYILYLKEKGSNREKEETIYANKRGLILGHLFPRELIIDGTGSIFPSLYINEGSGAPLWRLVCNWSDPYTDQWMDCISLNFNKDNKLFKYINNDDPKNFDIQLLREILSSALVLIVEKLRGQGFPVDNLDDDVLEGSILGVFKYFSDVCKCNFSDQVTTSESIRIYIEKTFNLQ